MKYYFKIQGRRVARHLQEFGIHPIFGLSILGILFVGLSILLFSQLPEYACYIYLILAVNLLFTLSNLKNREFLKLSLSLREFKALRNYENLVVCLPFLFFLTIHFEFLFTVILLVFMLGTANIELNNSISFSFKTPFSNHPFEFSSGFRKTILVYPIAYGLAIIAVSVGNMNLGIFSILLLGLSNAHFYSTIEPDYYVWVYREGAKKMLSQKLKRGIVNLILSVSPIFVSLFIFFPEGAFIQLLAVVLTILFFLANVVLKYAHFPRSTEVIQGILLPLLFLFPPLLLLIIPYYYGKAVQQINPITQ
jgi:hypothetical protein